MLPALEHVDGLFNRLVWVSGFFAEARNATYCLRLDGGSAQKAFHAAALFRNPRSTSGGVTSGSSQNALATLVSLVGPAATPASATRPSATSLANRRRLTFDHALPGRRGVNR